MGNYVRMTEDISQMGQSNGTIKCGQPKTFNGTIKRDTLVTVLSFCKLKVKIFKRKKIFYSLMNSKDIIRYSFCNAFFYCINCVFIRDFRKRILHSKIKCFFFQYFCLQKEHYIYLGEYNSVHSGF